MTDDRKVLERINYVPNSLDIPLITELFFVTHWPVPMDVIHALVLKRNAVETTPFVAVYKSNATLMCLERNLENRCQQLDFECSTQRNKIHTVR